MERRKLYCVLFLYAGPGRKVCCLQKHAFYCQVKPGKKQEESYDV